MKWVNLPLTAEVHQTISIIALAITALHAWLLLFDMEYGFGLRELLVPLASPYRPIAVGSGVLAAYLAAMVTGSFYVRRLLGQRVWRAMHYATFALFLLALAHGIAAGTDSSSLPMGVVYAVTGGLVLFLTYLRILGGRYVPTPRPVPAHVGRLRNDAT
jgi:hypothetical protein